MTDFDGAERGGIGDAPADRAELDRQLSPRLVAKDFEGDRARWAADSEVARARPEARLDMPYGEGERERIDLFVPDGAGAGAPVPLFAFIHGGFWQQGAREAASYAAPAFLARGAAFAAIGYTLAPEASLSRIVDEIRRAYRFLAETAPDHGIDPARIAVGGHSAGGHLAACLLTRAGDPGEGVPPPAALALVSGVFALGPVRRSYVNDKVGMTPEEARTLSPAIYPPRADVPVDLWIGADEPAEFHRQSAVLEASWRPHLSRLSIERLPGRDHFDVLEEMDRTGGAILSRVLARLGLGEAGAP